MNKIFYTLLLALVTTTAFANPGDTTWVQAQTDIWLGDTPHNFDEPAHFPDGTKTYRRIYMIFTMGRYTCPGSPQYCGDWDYTVQNTLMTPNGDTVELGRLITPYGNSTRITLAWKNRYVYDVTDFYPLLKGDATMRISYSGYSGGYTGDIKFAFIEGTPPRNVLGVDRLWHGSFAFGKASDPIENHIASVNKTMPSGAQSAELKFIVSGHGSDGNQCAEFCKKYYDVKVNGNAIDHKDIWRSDCGSNELYPQNGTWVYERGNWCPGALINTNSHNLTGLSAGNAYDVDVDFESYTDNGSASYIIEGDVIYYGGFNRTLDASLEQIVSPTNHEMFFRENPATGRPVVTVKNSGSATITSLSFEYDIAGGTTYYYTWQGSIAPLTDTRITLPAMWELRTASGSNVFNCKITKVNSADDEDATNNKLSTGFAAAPQWEKRLIVSLVTNGSSVNGHSETSWTIYDENNNIVKQRNNLGTKTTNVDTVDLGPGSYHLTVDDAGCDGINWWAYQFYNPNPGIGSFSVKKMSSPLPLSITGYYNGDFGCGFTQYFNVNWPTAITDVKPLDAQMNVYPNPASDVVNVSFAGLNVDGNISIVDAVGKTVAMQHVKEGHKSINISELPNGIYSVMYMGADNVKLQQKFVIVK